MQPMWMRLLALACLLFVGVASSAQAVHIHGKWLPDNTVKASTAADASQLPGGEEHCPLCLAMHSAALPISAHVEPVRLLVVELRPTQTVEHIPESQWHFAMFSRPPPLVKTL
jgi:hypothetical protein